VRERERERQRDPVDDVIAVNVRYFSHIHFVVCPTNPEFRSSAFTSHTSILFAGNSSTTTTTTTTTLLLPTSNQYLTQPTASNIAMMMPSRMPSRPFPSAFFLLQKVTLHFNFSSYLDAWSMMMMISIIILRIVYPAAGFNLQP
jgi:hypothetical protein